MTEERTAGKDNISDSKENSRETDLFKQESSETDNRFLTELSASRQARRTEKSIGEIALRELKNPRDEIFNVKSGQYRGMPVPEQLRCAIFQSNIAVEAGIIKPGEVTIRALEFEKVLKKHGYKSEAFDPSRGYPDGTYIVGEGARDGTNSRHVSLVFAGMLIHTKDGVVVNEPISNKFFPGAYDRMTVLQAKPQKKKP